MASPAKSTGSTKLDAVVQNVKAEEPGKLTGLQLYSRFALAGAVCCSVTHGGLTPVDVYVASLAPALAKVSRGLDCDAITPSSRLYRTIAVPPLHILL